MIQADDIVSIIMSGFQFVLYNMTKLLSCSQMDCAKYQTAIARN